MASEIVTPLIWEVGAEAYKDRAADGCYPDMGAFTAALQAVAPLIRRAALEEAAEAVRPKGLRPCDCDVCFCANSGDLANVTAWDQRQTDATAILALAEKQP